MPDNVTRQILTALGNRELRAETDLVQVIPPFWRRDLTREIDLVEEVARIHGYDKIPEDASVPMVPSHRTREDRVLARVRTALCAAGFDEALTLSVVDENWSEAFNPWTTAPALAASMPVLAGPIACGGALFPACSVRGEPTRRWPTPTSSCSKRRKCIYPPPVVCLTKTGCWP